MRIPFLLFALAAATAAATGGFAMTDKEIPSAPVHDAIMAPPGDIAATDDWARAVFCGESPAAHAGRIALEVRRQDYNVLRFGQSCMETPIRIG